MQQSGGDLIVGEVSWQRIVPPTAPNLEESGCEKQFVLFFSFFCFVFLFQLSKQKKALDDEPRGCRSGSEVQANAATCVFFGPCMLPPTRGYSLPPTALAEAFTVCQLLGTSWGAVQCGKWSHTGCTAHRDIPSTSPNCLIYTHTAEEMGQLTHNEGDLITSSSEAKTLIRGKAHFKYYLNNKGSEGTANCIGDRKLA